MIVNISELEKGNGELYILHGNLQWILQWHILGPVDVIHREISEK